MANRLTPYGLTVGEDTNVRLAGLVAKVGTNGKVLSRPDGFASVLPKARRVIRRNAAD